MLSSDDVINDELLGRVIQAGHSRVPVYAMENKQARLPGLGRTAAPLPQLLLLPLALRAKRPGTPPSWRSTVPPWQAIWA